MPPRWRSLIPSSLEEVWRGGGGYFMRDSLVFNSTRRAEAVWGKLMDVAPAGFHVAQRDFFSRMYLEGSTINTKCYIFLNVYVRLVATYSYFLIGYFLIGKAGKHAEIDGRGH